MSPVSLWTVILGGMLVTYAGRLSFLALLPAERLPVWLRQSLRLVPPAVLAALVAPELLLRDSSLDIALGNDRLAAGLVASLAAWRLRNTWFTLGSGLLAFFLLSGA